MNILDDIKLLIAKDEAKNQEYTDTILDLSHHIIDLKKENRELQSVAVCNQSEISKIKEVASFWKDRFEESRSERNLELQRDVNRLNRLVMKLKGHAGEVKRLKAIMTKASSDLRHDRPF